MTDVLELDALREDFPRVVDTTSRDLSARLRVRHAGEPTEPLPKEPDPPTGQLALAVLRQRRTDLTGDDIRVMREVVDTVGSEAAPENEREPEDARLRHRPMPLGHDPLKA